MLPQGNTQKNLSRMFFISSHPFPPTSGDIEVFKDMAPEKLNLFGCNNLTGEWVQISLLTKISVLYHVESVLPQGNT